jgi:purine-binding chemotaxis protein CheW
MQKKDIIDAVKRRKELVQVKTDNKELLRVSIDAEWYGIDITDIVEVIKRPKIFNIPHTPDYVVGVINLRGDILAIVDIRKVLELPSADIENQKHIVVVEKEDTQVGILVDNATDVVSIPVSDIKPLLPDASKESSLTIGEVQVNGEVITALNLDDLIKSEE